MNLFITGGSRGIGAAVVWQAVAAGYDVAFTYRQNEASAAAVVAQARTIRPDARLHAYALDVRNSEAVDQVGEQVLKDFGDIQVVVNNAGVVRSGMAATMPDADWHEVLDTHLSGAFYVCRHFLPAMVMAGYGRIINMSSVVAGGMSGMANYAAAKAGLIGLTRSLAKEYGRKNITANCILAGQFDTEMTQSQLSEHVRQFGRTYAPIAGAQNGNPADIGRLVMFLASDAGRFINGTEIYITGGLDWLP